MCWEWEGKEEREEEEEGESAFQCCKELLPSGCCKRRFPSRGIRRAPLLLSPSTSSILPQGKLPPSGRTEWEMGLLGGRARLLPAPGWWPKQGCSSQGMGLNGDAAI